MPERPSARVYIDGFNLYYGALRSTQYKWVNLEDLARRLMPSYEIDHITYCIARVTPSDHDPDVHVRQDVFFQALSAMCPRLEIVEGIFKTGQVKGFRVAHGGCACCADAAETSCGCCGEKIGSVIKAEEKGSDVNLATRLVSDGYEDRFAAALVISDDSDLQPAVDVVTERLGKPVIVCNPRYKRKWHSLIGTERRTLRPAAIAACQMPDPVELPDGAKVVKPTSW